MNRQSSLRTLRDARPRTRPGFETSIERYDALRAQITATPPPPQRTARRRSRRTRLIGFSAAAVAACSVAGVIVALTASALGGTAGAHGDRRCGLGDDDDDRDGAGHDLDD